MSVVDIGIQDHSVNHICNHHGAGPTVSMDSVSRSPCDPAALSNIAFLNRGSISRICAVQSSLICVQGPRSSLTDACQSLFEGGQPV